MKVLKTTGKGRRKPMSVLAVRMVRFDIYQKLVLWAPRVVVFQ